MSERRCWRAVRPVMGAAAALALGGCAATHVGEDWQCPLAQGAVCASVAAADPAVPDSQAADGLAPRTPLYRAGEGPRPPEAVAEAVPERRCAAGCDPLAWLASLLAGAAGEDDRARPEASPVVEAADPGLEGSPAADPSTAQDAPEGVASPTPPAGPVPDTPAEATAAAHTAPLPAPEDPSGEALRTGEVIGRVWIAPFVDAGGIYREGSWVRVVIAPAEWRVP